MNVKLQFWAVDVDHKAILVTTDREACKNLAKTTKRSCIRLATYDEIPSVEVKQELPKDEPIFNITPRAQRRAEEEYSLKYGFAPTETVWELAMSKCQFLKPATTVVEGETFITAVVNSRAVELATDLSVMLVKWAHFNPVSVKASAGEWAAGA